MADDALDDPTSSTFDQLLRAVAASPSVPLEEEAELAAGTAIEETFRIVSKLGKGGMGIVYLADDVALDRRVAIKLHTSARNEREASRMWREARAMARLTHPNVVTVYEVGVYDDRVYIAMEVVDGDTLKGWLKSPRSWREILDVFVQAGNGLAAAHRVGLVHRDFKPSNVLVGDDGRVTVADFGLARAADEADSDVSASRSPSPSPSVADRVTATGVAIGTPAYMAPEQRDGVRADPRADQYAFCVSLYEALYGAWPSTDEPAGSGSPGSPGSPGTAPRGEVSRRASAPGHVPAWLRAVVTRGLASDPDDRFPEMDALIAALQSDPTRRRRIVLGAVVVGLVALGVWGAGEFRERRARSECRAGADAIEQTWNAGASGHLRGAFVASGALFADTAHERVESIAAQFADTWRRDYADACIATEVESARDRALWDASRYCFEARRDELGSLLDVLSDQVDVAMVQSAVAAVGGLGRLELCSDDEWLHSHPPDEHPGARDQRARIRRAGALLAAGRYDDGLAIAREVLEEVDVDNVDLHAKALIVTAELADAAGQTDEAVSLFTDGYESATAAGADHRALEAATELIYVVGVVQMRHDEGVWWSRVARGLARRLGVEDSWEGAALHNNLGMVFEAQKMLDEALAEHQRALEIRERVAGTKHPHVAYSHNNIGTTYLALGKQDEALAELSRAAEILIEVLGDDHPQIAISYSNLGVLYGRQKRYDDAVRAHERALAITRAGLGPEHPQAAMSHSKLGNMYARQKRYDEALRELERAIEIGTAAYGPGHRSLGISYNHLGNLHLAREHYAEAEQAHGRALAIAIETLGAEHDRTATSHRALGRVHRAAGHLAEAEESLQKALAIYEKTRGADHRTTAAVRESVDEVKLARAAR